MALQTANQFQLGTDFSRLGSGIQQGQQIANQFQIGQQNKAIGEQNNAKFNQEQSTIRATVLNKLATSMKGVPEEQRHAFLKNQAPELKKFNIDAGIFAQESLDDASLDEAILSTQSFIAQKEGPSALEQAQTAKTVKQTELLGIEKPEIVSALDEAKIAKINAEIAGASQGAETPALNTLIAGASPEVQAAAKSAFELSGGGDKGVKALVKVLEAGEETTRRAAAPETLKANFPNANEAELKELQAVVDSSKTTESGFKEAGKLREKQRQVKIGNDTKARGLEIITKLFDNDELDDVIGSIEGSDKSIIPFVDKKSRSDKEAEAIADIEELESILTAGSLKLMSGVLSESDIGILKNIAAGGLNRMRGEKRFREDLARIQEKLKGALGVKDKDLTKTTDEDLLSF
jgi:hypothetical protein